MSWKPEVTTDNRSWNGNALRFETKAEAEHYVADLAFRWTSVRDSRVVEVDEPPNYIWKDGRAERLD